MMGNLVPCCQGFFTGIGEGLHRVTRDTPRRLDVVFLKQLQQALCGHLGPKLATRQIGWGGLMKGAIPEGEGIKVDSEPYGHLFSSGNPDLPCYLLIGHSRAPSIDFLCVFAITYRDRGLC